MAEQHKEAIKELEVVIATIRQETVTISELAERGAISGGLSADLILQLDQYGLALNKAVATLINDGTKFDAGVITADTITTEYRDPTYKITNHYPEDTDG